MPYVSGRPSAATAPSMLRTMNQRYLLELLYSTGPETRPKLARDAGLSQPTVFAALADLEEAGLVRVAGQTELQSGRPAAVYEADPSAGTVAAVDLGHDWVRAVVTDLSGAELGKVEIRNTARSTKGLVAIVHDAVELAAGRAKLRITDITHTAIASPGVYRAQIGRVAYAAQLPGWQHPKLIEALQASFGGAVSIENDVNLAALSEHTIGRGAGTSPFIYLHIGTGVGIGLIIDGQLYRGFGGAAGEVGFVPYINTTVTAPQDRNRGMLEEAMGAEAVVRHAHEAGMTGVLTAAKVFEAARGGDERALLALRHETEALARLLANVSAILDPELIVVGGGIGQNLDLLSVGLSDRLAELTPFVPNLAVSALGASATVKGAVARGTEIAREMIFEQRMARGCPGSRGTWVAVPRLTPPVG